MDQNKNHKRSRTKLSVLLFASGFSLQFIAWRAGVSPQYVSNVISGSQKPSDALLSTLAELLGVVNTDPSVLLQSVDSRTLRNAVGDLLGVDSAHAF